MGKYKETYERTFKNANETFKGSSMNEENYKKYTSILTLAKEITQKESLFYKISYNCTDGKKGNRNALVWLDIECPSMISAKEIREPIASMIQTADDFTVASLSGGIVRLSFGIRDVWSK